MRSLIGTGLAAGAVAVLTGCCTANVNLLPKSGGRAVVVSTSSEESCAYEKAKEKAAEYCTRRGRSYVVVDDNAAYQGMDKSAKGLIEGAGAIMGKSVYLDSSQDYRVRMTIACKKQRFSEAKKADLVSYQAPSGTHCGL